MKYEEIYTRFYVKMTDSSFFSLPEDIAYAKMCLWLHSTASLPYVRKCFRNITFDDEIMEMTYALSDTITAESNDEFVIELFAQGMILNWYRPQLESQINMARVLGGKEEKMLQNNLKLQMERFNSLELKLKKMIRDHGYYNGEVS